VKILADLDVKYATPISSSKSIAAEFDDCVDRAHADGVIVSGAATGQRVATEALDEALAARTAGRYSTPVFVGSGMGVETVSELLAAADGAIVGTALKEAGQTTNPVSTERVEQFMDRVERVRAETNN